MVDVTNSKFVDTNDNTKDLGDLDLNDEVKAKLAITIDTKQQKEKKGEALKNVQKLLSISERYSQFCNEKLHKVFVDDEQTRVNNMMKRNTSASVDNIPYFTGKLKDYQVVGVKWMKTLFEHGVNGILADEMGLGKTVQIIALICHLMEQVKGPFLIVVPLSTLPNWKSEFARFAPEIPVVIFHANKEDRPSYYKEVLKSYKLNRTMVRPVVITTNGMFSMELGFFSKITWTYLIIDEGHCLKNHKTQISKNMRVLRSTNKLILTGTPLQNNLKELWSMLNFIMPKIFKNVNTFASLFSLMDFDDNRKIVEEESTTNVIGSLHKIIQPFMLRRLKSEVLDDLVPKKEVLVFCPLSQLQRSLYMYTIKGNLTGLIGKKENKEELWIDKPRPKRKCTVNKNYTEPNVDDSFEEAIDEAEKILGEKVQKTHKEFIYNVKMQNPLMMFRKIVNHPYLIHTPVTPDGKNLLISEKLVTECGKMFVLDIMLSKLKTGGHKVLIFSTFVILLDLVEELLIMRKHRYCRLDGKLSLSDREKCVYSFNNDPSIYCFLISTRAGGLGLNLAAADTVILYDRDWNPQIDVQAQDRCHRIGQTKPVMVYSLVTKNTIDEKIVNCGNMKRKLEKLVIKKGKFTDPTSSKSENNELDLDDLLEFLEKDDTSLKVHQNSHIFTDQEWNELLDRSELYKEMENLQKSNESK